MPSRGDNNAAPAAGAGRERGAHALPEGCPVQPLGLLDRFCFYRDAAGRARMLAADEHTRDGIFQLFGGDAPTLALLFPRRGDAGAVIGWDPELASEALMAACARAGILWHPERLDPSFEVARPCYLGRWGMIKGLSDVG